MRCGERKSIIFCNGNTAENNHSNVCQKCESERELHMYMRERENSSDEIATLDKKYKEHTTTTHCKKKMEIVLSQTLTRNPNETKHVTEYRIKSNQTKRHTETEIERVAFFELIEENSKSEREDEEHKDVVLRQKKSVNYRWKQNLSETKHWKLVEIIVKLNYKKW